MRHSTENRGFQEIPHTADWAMRVWAEDMPSLFVEAAHGLNALAGARLVEGARVKRFFRQTADDAESLLVTFLSELVYLQEQENLGFENFNVTLNGQQLSVEMEGAQLEQLEKPVKAVTYHDMRISKTNGGYEVQVVFDV